MGARLSPGAAVSQAHATPPARVPFAEAVSQQRPYLVRFARARLRDDALADDMVQDTLVAALQGADEFRQQASLRTWLTAILLRRMADDWRRQRRWTLPAGGGGAAATGVDDRTSDHDAAPAAEAVDWLDPQRRLESRQMLDALGSSLAALTPTAAQLLSLRALDGLGNHEAAQVLGLSPGKAALLLHRTRARLRRAVAASARTPSRGARAVAAHVG